MLPIEEYERLLEDLEDLAVIAQRRHEPAESRATVVERLERKWQGGNPIGQQGSCRVGSRRWQESCSCTEGTRGRTASLRMQEAHR